MQERPKLQQTKTNLLTVNTNPTRQPPPETLRILPGEHFNNGTPETTPKIQIERMGILSGQMEGLGYSLDQMHAQASRVSRPEHENRVEVQEVVRELHDAAALLFGQWSLSHETKDRDTEYAAARLFNRITGAARKVDARHGLFDKTHRRKLAQAIQRDVQTERDSGSSYDPYHLSYAIELAARERTHENAWAWVVLPTFPGQHYGRTLLDAVDIPEAPYKVFVTQPTFTNGEATLFHTHGQNWAFSRPLGQPGENRHSNTLWTPQSREQLFPLRQLPKEKGGQAYYVAGEVAVIPPKTIHGIAGAREKRTQMKTSFSLEEIAKLPPRQRQQRIEQMRFGQLSCLHVYRADASLAAEFIENPVTILPNQPEKDFFEKNDMIVFNHTTKEAWAGGGGAWEQRMLQYGQAGEHCGLCFVEDDPRRKQLPPKVVYDRFIDPSSSSLIHYTFT